MFHHRGKVTQHPSFTQASDALLGSWGLWRKHALCTYVCYVCSHMIDIAYVSLCLVMCEHSELALWNIPVTWLHQPHCFPRASSCNSPIQAQTSESFLGSTLYRAVPLLEVSSLCVPNMYVGGQNEETKRRGSEIKATDK